jgi:hypothetical protein
MLYVAFSHWDFLVDDYDSKCEHADKNAVDIRVPLRANRLVYPASESSGCS